MRTLERVHAVLHALQQAPPYDLVETLAGQLAKLYGATETDVMLADYAMVALRPVLATLPLGTPGIAIDNSAEGRVFASQRPQAERRGGYLLHLPVTADGERFGVLSVRFPEPPDPAVSGAPGDSLAGFPSSALLEELRDIGTALAHALRGADRITDRYQRVRRMARLTMAAEMQWGLLPGVAHEGEGYRLAGLLEPAYAVYGDNFDWACGARWLTLSVSNGMGQGIPASLLTTLAVTALRNARRSGAGLEEQAGLADEAVHGHYGGVQYVSTLLLRLDAMTGNLYAVDAGSPQLILLRQGQVREIELERQLPLGMFGSTSYVEQLIRLRPGDRVFVVSDGVHAALSPRGGPYGGDQLRSALRATRLQPPAEAVRSLIRGLLDFNEGPELADDAVIVCFDWTAQTDHPAEIDSDDDPGIAGAAGEADSFDPPPIPSETTQP